MVALSPGIAVDRYELVSLLGRGAMGEVWRARHRFTRADCAVKVLQTHLANDARLAQLFTQEAQVGSRLRRHPNIVSVQDAGFDAQLGVAFLAMELLDGQTLEDRRRDHGPLDWALAAAVFRQLGEAMQVAHEAQVIHRDLKPANLMLVRDQGDLDLVKVLDFGIARVLAEDPSRAATMVGTPAYSAPEQLGEEFRRLAAAQGVQIARQVSPATDVWALGAVAYDLLTGSEPGALWGASSAAGMPLKVALEEAPQPSQRGGANAHLLPAGFDAWFHRCCRRDAAQRWPTFGEAARALSELLTAPAAACSAPAPSPAPSPAATRCDVGETFQPFAPAPDYGIAPAPGDAAARSATPALEGSAAATAEPTATAPSRSVVPRSRRVLPMVSAFVALVGVMVTAVLVAAAVRSPGPLDVTVRSVGGETIPTLELRVDGALVCTATPCQVPGLSEGTQVVSVAAAGYQAIAPRTVLLHGGDAEEVSFELDHLPATVLEIGALGGELSVLIDGQEYGNPPLKVTDLLPGTHRLKLIDGRGRYATYDETVLVRASQVTAVRPKLVVWRGMVKLTAGANAEGAKIALLDASGRRLIPHLPLNLEIAGDQRVEVVATRAGFAEFRQAVDFSDGVAEKTVTIALAVAGSAPSPGQASAADPERAMVGDTAALAAAASAGQGVLNIASIPIANVILDGRPLGLTPRIGVRVSAGTHTIVFVHPELGRKVETVVVGAGKEFNAATRF
ncbi:MAG: serine/threonine protein kinase [Polyangiaceae bacterium]|nr:serine/threonine protein kinase [Polyangiaceae bacterium]